jgi:hypothetical protein
MGVASPASRVDFADGVLPFFSEDGFFLRGIYVYPGWYKFQLS